MAPSHALLVRLIRAVKHKGESLPEEIAVMIASSALGTPPPSVQPQVQSSALPRYYTPPSGCPLMRMPVELRRLVFATSLPARDAIHSPKCMDPTKSEVADRRVTFGAPGSVTNLMRLNKQICGEITQVLYQERWFAVHVHEGLKKGGVEFLHSGRQPLHYQEEVYDGRFEKFEHNTVWGFNRIKKVRIQIFPSDEAECRHTAINTYFINQALCRLMGRGSKEEDRITSLIIEFPKRRAAHSSTQPVGRRAIQRVEHYWADPDTGEPWATSIHKLPDIQLVLRPFAELIGCHSVQIKLPADVARHEPTLKFVEKVRASMVNKPGSASLFDDDLERHINGARYAMEAYVSRMITGKRVEEMDRMDAEDVLENSGADDGDVEGGFRGLLSAGGQTVSQSEYGEVMAAIRASEEVEYVAAINASGREYQKQCAAEVARAREASMVSGNHHSGTLIIAASSSTGTFPNGWDTTFSKESIADDDIGVGGSMFGARSADTTEEADEAEDEDGEEQTTVTIDQELSPLDALEKLVSS